MLKFKTISSSRTMILIGVMVVVLSVTAFVLLGYFGVWSQPAATGPSLNLVALPPVNLKFEKDILTQEPFSRLTQHGQYPVSSGPSGKNNPFLPGVVSSATSTSPAATTTGPLFFFPR